MLFMSLGGSAQAADAPTRCMVRLIHALRDGEGIDPQIVKLRPYLQKDAFASFKRFVLLDKREFALQPKLAERLPLPNGKEASLTYLEMVDRNDGKRRLRMRLEIVTPGQAQRLLDTTFLLEDGGVVMQAGQKHDSGQLILGVSCAAK
jgi:hypothetical protein